MLKPQSNNNNICKLKLNLLLMNNKLLYKEISKMNMDFQVTTNSFHKPLNTKTLNNQIKPIIMKLCINNKCMKMNK